MGSGMAKFGYGHIERALGGLNPHPNPNLFSFLQCPYSFNLNKLFKPDFCRSFPYLAFLDSFFLLIFTSILTLYNSYSEFPKMSQQQMKQEPVELLEKDEDDDIRSIAGSEWTVDTSATSRNGGAGNVSMGKLKSKIRILEAELKALKAEQKCAEMKANLEKSEIVAKLEDAQRKALMASQIELDQKMEQFKADFADKFVALEKETKSNFYALNAIEEKQQKEIAEMKAKTDSENKAILEKLKAAEEKPQLVNNELNSTIQAMQQKMEELATENAQLKAKIDDDDSKAIFEELIKAELTEKMRGFETVFVDKLAFLERQMETGFDTELRTLKEKLQKDIDELKAKTGEEITAILARLEIAEEIAQVEKNQFEQKMKELSSNNDKFKERQQNQGRGLNTLMREYLDPKYYVRHGSYGDAECRSQAYKSHGYPFD